MYPLVKKLIIADDHPLTRRGLRMLITNELKIMDITEVNNFNNLLKELESGEYSHLVLDLILSDVNSAEKFVQLRKKYPGLAILIYSMQPKEVYGPHLLRLGARAFLNKQSPDEKVICCLKSFFQGKKCKDSSMDKEEETIEDGNPFRTLSQRELEVLPHLLQGNGVKEIAGIMQLKPNTVATFKTRIFEKLAVKNLVELNQLASLYQFNLTA
jgi:two-component system, NarL family, invasion response regulator UvrY